MQFEWWRKREKRKPAIRLVRDSSSDEGGGPFGRYISVLEWCSVAPTVVYFVSFGQHLGRICTFISQSTESVEIETEFEVLEFFCLASSSSRSGYGYFSSTLCTLRRSIDHASRYLFFFVFPSAVSSSICPFIRHFIIVSSLSFFFFFRFAIESFLRSFLIFFPIRSSLPLSITRKKKNTMERDFIRRYLKKAIFR